MGGAIAKTFAREGTNVFLACRMRDSLEKVAGDIAAGAGLPRWPCSTRSTETPDPDWNENACESLFCRGKSLMTMYADPC